MKLTDVTYLKNTQYKDSSNLDARRTLHERFCTNTQGWYAWVFERLSGLPDDARILEVGCGSGHLWLRNLAHIPTEWTVTLSDFSPGMVAQASVSLAGDDRFSFAAFDVQALPLPDAQFDAVIANHMLYHVPDKHQALTEIARVLKPGGALFAATNGQAHMAEIMTWLQAVGVDAQPGFGFRLEDGQEWMERVFDAVKLHRYDDLLVVNEVEAVMNYIVSMRHASEITPDATLQLGALLKRTFAAEGELRIRTESGVFEGINRAASKA